MGQSHTAKTKEPGCGLRKSDPRAHTLLHTVLKWDGSHWRILSNGMVRCQRTPPAGVLQRDCRGAKEGRRRPCRVETVVVRERLWWSGEQLSCSEQQFPFIHSFIHPFIHSFTYSFIYLIHSGCSYAPFIVLFSPVWSPMWGVKDCGGEGRYNSHPHKVQNHTGKGDGKHDCIGRSRRSGLLGHVGLISKEPIHCESRPSSAHTRL